ncbi:MAG: hypothetical protein H0T76_26060 [Nannocystis sp.]|nr:hypothetical protein [Nannocystis sp.]MBA3549958.1 hypothetical protein [Nannocystis sp.]
MARTSILNRTILSSLLLGAVIIAAPGCKKGSSDTAELTPPPAPTYENPFDELNDIPKQMTAQLDWVTQPLRDASALGDDFTAIQAKYSIDVKALGGMATAAFKDGKIEISADVAVTAEAKADIEALLGKIKAAGVAIGTIPKRATKASGAIGKMSIKVVGLAPKATAYLKKQLADASAEMSAELKGSIELNLTSIPEMPNKIKATGKDAIAKVKAIPNEAKTTFTELVAAFSGEGAFPKGVTNNDTEQPVPEVEGEGEGEAAAE